MPEPIDPHFSASHPQAVKLDGRWAVWVPIHPKHGAKGEHTALILSPEQADELAEQIIAVAGKVREQNEFEREKQQAK